ncbi:MAG: hypothetical protein KAW16_08075 [candidate division Zixibacteria bacterium]|nr:hypothetical protein [candidate division Zixibacteria bacterium]
MKAKSLEEAISNFDPTKKLEHDWEFYVERAYNPLRLIKTYILNNKGPQKLLFSGHMGSGKSTELNKLMDEPEIRSNFFIVNYSVRDQLDPLNLNYIDVLISIGAKIFEKAVDENVKLDKQILKYLDNWKNKIIERTKSDVVTKAGGLSLNLKLYFLGLLGKIQREHETRETIRQTIEPQLSELIDIINSIIDGINVKIKKEIIVCIDDLDKLGFKEARELFYSRGIPLTQPRCKIIFTIPLDLKCSDEFKKLLQFFNESWVLPNIKIADKKTGKPDRSGYDKMTEYVDKRINLGFISQDALNTAIRYSGGVFREMARVMQNACTFAVSDGDEELSAGHIEQAARKIRDEYRLFLTEDQYIRLKECHKTKELRNSDKFKDLLGNLSLLEYRNKENWCDVHPIVLPLIQETKKGAKPKGRRKTK